MALVDYFLKIATIDGESKDNKYKDHIEIESWSWGESNTSTGHTGGGHGAGKVNAQDFHFVMKVNKASPKLILACAEGEHFPDATVIARKAGKGQQDFLKFKFSDVFVSSYQTGGSGHNDVVPTDQISLGYAKMEVEYKEQKQDGSLGGAVKAGYDYQANKKL
jgi:type VI secretion system secreted protein Hcp